MRSLASLYLLSLLCIPFYIGIEPVRNAQINVERLILLLLALSIPLKHNLSVVSSAIAILFQNCKTIALLVFAYFSIRVLASLYSPFSVSTYIIINELASQLLIFVVFFGIFVFAPESEVKRVKAVLAFSMLVIGTVVAVETVSGKNPFTSLAPADAGRAIVSAAIEREGLLRAKGTFEHPLTLAHCLSLVMPLFLFRHTGLVNTSMRWTIVVCLVAIGILTGSRSFMLIMATQFAIWLLIEPPRLYFSGRPISLRALFLLLLPPLFFGAIMLAEQRAGSEVFSSYVREAQIRNGLSALSTKPWLGFGPGPGAIAAIVEGTRFGDNALQLWERNLTTVDNWYLSVLLSSGIPSFFIFASMNFATLLAGFTALYGRHSRCYLYNTGELPLLAALLVGLLCSNVIMLILSIFTLHPLHYIFMAWIVAILAKVRVFELRKFGEKN